MSRCDRECKIKGHGEELLKKRGISDPPRLADVKTLVCKRVKKTKKEAGSMCAARLRDSRKNQPEREYWLLAVAMVDATREAYGSLSLGYERGAKRNRA